MGANDVAQLDPDRRLIVEETRCVEGQPGVEQNGPRVRQLRESSLERRRRADVVTDIGDQ
jgi:hypothetical protein